MRRMAWAPVTNATQCASLTPEASPLGGLLPFVTRECKRAHEEYVRTTPREIAQDRAFEAQVDAVVEQTQQAVKQKLEQAAKE